MKAKELAEILLKHPDRIIVAASDSEGNLFSEVHDVSVNMSYDRIEREVGLTELTPELREEGYSDEDVIEGVPCFVIWP